MAITFRVEALKVYQEALNFINCIYFTSKRFPKEELFGLTNQIRRKEYNTYYNQLKFFSMNVIKITNFTSF